MVTIIIFVLVLLVLIVSHEFGHAMAAWLTGCRVEEFGVGFPPKLFGKKIGDTLFTVNAVPLGGFVRITGEDGVTGVDGTTTVDKKSFANKNFVVKLIILVAGVTMNILLAVVIYTIIAGVGSSVPIEGIPANLPIVDKRVEIVAVEKNDILAKTNIKAGDVISKVGDQIVADSAAAATAIKSFTGSELFLTLKNEKETRIVNIKFNGQHEAGKPVGLSLLDVGTYRVVWYQAPIEGVRATVRVVKMTATGIGGLFYNLIWQRQVPSDVAGPVGIAKIVGQVGSQGVLPLMELMAVLSVNLALINILPIPALDGGRVLFVIIEALGIRTFRGKIEQMAHSIGFVLLILLVLLITINDIRRIIHP
ncbi:MAG: site-2 protease family protein [bacterium]|nr:site-2 protease family protein [bacterium]